MNHEDISSRQAAITCVKWREREREQKSISYNDDDPLEPPVEAEAVLHHGPMMQQTILGRFASASMEVDMVVVVVSMDVDNGVLWGQQWLAVGSLDGCV